MKRIIALILIITLAFSVLSIAVYAEPVEHNPVVGEARFFDRFEAQFSQSTMGPTEEYEEVYYHYTDPEDESTLDWVLVRAYHSMVSPEIYYAMIGGRPFEQDGVNDPFEFPYCVYDVKEDKFTGLLFDQYEGLSDVFRSIELKYPANELGRREFLNYVHGLDSDCDDLHYRVLAYHDAKSEQRAQSEHYDPNCFSYNPTDLTWVLVEAYAEPSVSSEGKPASFYVGNSRLTSREAAWPFGSKLALYIPSDKRFISLNGYAWYYYEGLEDAILAQDFDALGIDNHEFLYRERFLDKYFPHWRETDKWWFALTIPFYDERYYHKDTDGAIDWVLIYTFNMAQVEWEVRTGCVIGNRAIYDVSECSAFESWYGVYDVRNNRFIALPNATDEVFPDLTDVVNHLKLGVMIGDVDRDGLISILDATYIQKILAGLMHNTMIEDMDMFYGKALNEDTIQYVSDYDRDGERSVLDATGIQKYLAGIR